MSLATPTPLPPRPGDATYPADGGPTAEQLLAERFPDLADLVAEHYDTAGDVGAELVDLPDELGLTHADDADETLTADVAPLLAAAAAPVLARAASWGQYEWATWAADVLRAAGCSVVEHPGWKSRGRPRSSGRFQPRGVLWHHDASKRGPSPYVAKFLAEIGRPDDNIPPPLSQFWVCMGCAGRHPVGTWHVLAAGRCNHAGVGAGWGRIGRDAGNAVTLGVETDNTINEVTPPAMYNALVKGTAALMRRMRSHPSDLLAAHKEYAKGRKTDPDDVAMPRARLDVAHRMAGVAPPPAKPPTQPPAPALPGRAFDVNRDLVPFPGTAAFRIGKSHQAVRRLDGWLIDVDQDKHHDGNGYQAGPVFTEYTRRNVAAFQRVEPKLKADPDGYPGPLTWNVLQMRAWAARRRAAAAGG